MVTHVVIPVRDQVHITQDIVEQLKRQEGWDKCWIFDNGSTDNTWEYLISVSEEDSRFDPIMAIEDGIYDMWDKGFRIAKHEGADFVGIFNNDIFLSPGTINLLNYALEDNPGAWVVYPDYNALEPGLIRYMKTSGTYRHGGMSGFCFMLRAAPIDWEPLVDPVFKWYGGDDDIAFEIEKRGGDQVRVFGLPVGHIQEATSRFHDLAVQKGLDMESIFRKWGR